MLKNLRAIAVALSCVSAPLAIAACDNQSEKPLHEVTKGAIGYPSVASALRALHARPDVQFSTENGWTIATDQLNHTIWSFAPRGYPAYPAVVKRYVVAQQFGSSLNMAVACEASKEACDDLVRTFARMNGLPSPN